MFRRVHTYKQVTAASFIYIYNLFLVKVDEPRIYLWVILEEIWRDAYLI